MTRERGYTTTTIDLFGPSLGSETLAAVSTVADVKAAVARFGGRLKAENPDASFYVSIRARQGVPEAQRLRCRQPSKRLLNDGRTVQVEDAAPAPTSSRPLRSRPAINDKA